MGVLHHHLHDLSRAAESPRHGGHRPDSGLPQMRRHGAGLAPPPGWQPPTEPTAGSADAAEAPSGTGSTITLRIGPPGEGRRAAAPADASRSGEPRKLRATAAAVAATLAGAPIAKTAAATPANSAAGQSALGQPGPGQRIDAAANTPTAAASRMHAIVGLCRQHWLLASLAPVASLAVVIGGWMLWGDSPTLRYATNRRRR